MKMVDISIKRPIMMTMVIAILMVLGLFSFLDIPIDLFPDIEIPVVTVQTIYPGANPDEVKNSISKEIENEVNSLSGLKDVRSISLENVSIVIIQFNMGNDIDVVAQDVKDKIDAIKYKFPKEAKEPSVLKYDLNSKPIMEMVLSGPFPVRELYRIADEELKDQFSKIDGVANVTIIGGQERIIRVELNRSQMDQYQLNADDVIKQITANNLDLPAGSLEKGADKYSIRVIGKAEQIDRIKSIMLITKFGPIQLDRIAEITNGFEKIEIKTNFYNLESDHQSIRPMQNSTDQNSVGVFVVRQSGANTVTVAKRIRNTMQQINQTMLPPGCTLYQLTDRSDFITDALSDATSSILFGILLTALVLLIFLHNTRSTIIAAIVIPISYISAFTFMKAFGFSLNTITLAGFSVTVGVLVTNTVVVLENIVRYLEMGYDPLQASSKGTSEILIAVAASALTNVVVFVPIAMMKGLVGQFFTEFGITVTVVTLLSLFISFTLTPMMASRMLNADQIKNKHRFGLWFDRQFEKLETWYQQRLSHLLYSRSKQFTYIAVTLGLFALSLFGAAKAGLEFIPPMDQGELDIRVQFPMNYNLEKTESLLYQVEQIVAEYGEVKAVFTQLGTYDEFTRGSNTGKISIRMIPKNRRNFSMTEFANRIRPRLTDFPGAEFNVLLPKSFGPDDPAIDLRLMGSDPDTLRWLAGQIKQMMDQIPGCADAYIDSKTGRPELKIIPDMQKLSHYGLTVYHLAMAARLSMEGAEASTLREKGREYDIKVLYRSDQVDDPAKIGYIPIQTQQGTIRLNEVARVEYGHGPTKATRINRMELVEIKANVSTGTMGELTHAIETGIKTKIPLPPGYGFAFGGDREYLADAITDLTKAGILAIILTFMLMCALLESYSQPIMIMSTIPMSLIGVVTSLLLTGTSFSLTSMISMIMLVGIVVNNAILMLDYTNELRRSGKSIDQALLEAGPIKLKPILMSTLAIMIGMLPMAWATGAGSEARAPIAIVSIGGLIVTTFLTLFIIPTVYRLYEGRKEKSSRLEPIKTTR